MPTLFPDQKLSFEKDTAEGMAVHNRRHTKVLLATASSFALSAWLTTKGLFDKAIEAGVATNEGMVTAMMSAAVAATLVGGGTMLLFGITVEASKRQHRQIAVLAGALLPFILGISTNYAVLGNAGPPSLVYDMRDAAVAHAHYYEAATLDASGAQSAEVALLPLQASICGLAGDEKTNGILTGSSGKGAVYAAYASGCTSIQTIVATLSETIIRTEERRELAKNIFADLNTIPKDTSMSVFERQAMFRDQVNILRKLIEESSAENVAKRLTAQLKILESSVASLGLQDGAFGQRQSQSIQGLKTALGLVSKTVGALLVAPDFESSEPPRPLLEMGAAVRKYWQRNIPQILLAVLIDCMAIWFVGLLVVSRASVQARHENSSAPQPLKGTVI